MASPHWPVAAYAGPQSASWPYTPADFARMDPSSDGRFYSEPRFVAHIDDNAISLLRQYYHSALPRSGCILELCSSWISHFPPDFETRARSSATAQPLTPLSEQPPPTTQQSISDALTQERSTAPSPATVVAGHHEAHIGPSVTSTNATDSPLTVTGYGMNREELEANSVLARRVVRDLNAEPSLEAADAVQGRFDATLCVVSVDYLVHPREVLAAVLAASKPGASVHLVVSNRCFPTKAVARWLTLAEKDRLNMVGDYLWFSGWRDIEIVTLEDGAASAPWSRASDPLWVVRGRKPV